jgi:hypothetical protein
MSSAISPKELWNPYERRVIVRVLPLSPSVRPLERPKRT